VRLRPQLHKRRPNSQRASLKEMKLAEMAAGRSSNPKRLKIKISQKKWQL
jgi:hypothetical protein